MLRISVEKAAESVSLILEGRLVGPWVDELDRVSAEVISTDQKLTVDLCGLTAMEPKGQLLLERLLQRGATLRCSDVMNQYLIEQMAQPAGRVEESCRPCRRAPSQSEWRSTQQAPLASPKAS